MPDIILSSWRGGPLAWYMGLGFMPEVAPGTDGACSLANRLRGWGSSGSSLRMLMMLDRFAGT